MAREYLPENGLFFSLSDSRWLENFENSEEDADFSANTFLAVGNSRFFTNWVVDRREWDRLRWASEESSIDWGEFSGGISGST